MHRLVEAALPLWGLSGASCTLAAERENKVFRVSSPEGDVALRIHRAGYRSDAEIASELDWMAAVSAGGLSVPRPLAARDGRHLQVIGGTQVDVLTWLSGAPLVETLALPGQPAPLFRELGSQMARLHLISDTWVRPDGFQRWSWDRKGLLGEAPLWDRFWENPHLSVENKAAFTAFRRRADIQLGQTEGVLDYGLIHADLVAANVLVDEGRLHLIDFDDGGFGFRLFDVATALLKHRERADYDVLKGALLEGYRAHRALDTNALDLFMALRAATYVGWNITRLDEPDGAARNARFIATLRSLCDCV